MDLGARAGGLLGNGRDQPLCIHLRRAFVTQPRVCPVPQSCRGRISGDGLKASLLQGAIDMIRLWHSILSGCWLPFMWLVAAGFSGSRSW